MQANQDVAIAYGEAGSSAFEGACKELLRGFNHHHPTALTSGASTAVPFTGRPHGVNGHSTEQAAHPAILFSSRKGTFEECPGNSLLKSVTGMGRKETGGRARVKLLVKANGSEKVRKMVQRGTWPVDA